MEFCTPYCLIDSYLCCRIQKPQNIIKIEFLSDWYTTFGDSYLSTNSNTLCFNPCNFNCCHSQRSQLYPPAKSCKILQHTDNSVPCRYLSYAGTRGIMNYLRKSHMQGRSWSTHFSVFHLCPALRASLWYHRVNVSRYSGACGSNSTFIGLIQLHILASIAYFDMNANIRGLGAWRINLIRCTWRFLNHNTELASTIYIWTADTVLRTLSAHALNCFLLSRASLFPGRPWNASSSTGCYIVALSFRYSLKLPTVFTLICFCLHSVTSLHQDGTYGQPGEESLFREESRSTPCASTYTCIQVDSQVSLAIKCLHCNLRV